MVQVSGKTSSARIVAAARRIVEGDMADAAAGRFSKTVFVANRAGDEIVERSVFDAAIESGIGAVSLRFGRDGGMPRRANIAFVHEGRPLEMRNCVLWCGDGDRVLLVPFDAREDCHFAIGATGLERREGRPAAALGHGVSRAQARLRETVRSLRQDDLGPTITFLTPSKAA